MQQMLQKGDCKATIHIMNLNQDMSKFTNAMEFKLYTAVVMPFLEKMDEFYA